MKFSINYSQQEIKLLKKLNSPNKIQDYLNTLKFNFEQKGETCFSPRMVIKNKTAHCMEGAMFAFCALEFNKQKSWLLDLRAVTGDFDHVVCVYKKNGYFGAISKTNHAVLRYREPIYKSIRELALSYFHEYFLKNGKKTLREYSELFSLKRFDFHDINSKHPAPSDGAPLLVKEGIAAESNWRTSPKNLFIIPQTLDKIKHFKILTSTQIKNLRRADAIEIKAGEIVEYKK